MNYITTTELRTKTTELVEKLEAGEEVGLLHRSKFVGSFRPNLLAQKPVKIIHDADAFIEDMKSLAKKIGKLNSAQMDKNYRDHMETKYGKLVS